jgi:hypothetical protein
MFQNKYYLLVMAIIVAFFATVAFVDSCRGHSCSYCGAPVGSGSVRVTQIAGSP